MSEPIVPRQAIHRAADTAAREYAQAPKGSPMPANPYPCGSDAAAEWHRFFGVCLLKYSAGEVVA